MRDKDNEVQLIYTCEWWEHEDLKKRVCLWRWWQPAESFKGESACEGQRKKERGWERDQMWMGGGEKTQSCGQTEWENTSDEEGELSDVMWGCRCRVKRGEEMQREGTRGADRQGHSGGRSRVSVTHNLREWSAHHAALEDGHHWALLLLHQNRCRTVSE